VKKIPQSLLLNNSISKLFILLFVLFIIPLLTACASLSEKQSDSSSLKHVIILIGDGMGFEQIKAAGLYLNGKGNSLTMETFPYQAELKTASANSPITDSAAAATAIATGVKVNNSVISVQIPGDYKELETALEYHKARQRRTGLVTTTFITHATPAAFGSHTYSRKNFSEIASDYLNESLPNILFGGINKGGITKEAATTAGYTVVTDLKSLQTLDTDKVEYVSGQFGKGHMPYEFDGVGDLPHLSQMTSKALDILDNDPDGFFLVVEGGKIDHSGHSNDIEKNIREIEEFDKAVQTVLEWASERKDTLIIVTADHETGGLKVISENGVGKTPTVSWSTEEHTAANVPIYAWGYGAEKIRGVMENTDLFPILIDN